MTNRGVRRFDKSVSLNGLYMENTEMKFEFTALLTLEKTCTHPFATLQNIGIPLSYPRVDVMIIFLIRGRNKRHLFRLLLCYLLKGPYEMSKIFEQSV
jgi:hypothetical protein